MNASVPTQCSRKGCSSWPGWPGTLTCVTFANRVGSYSVFMGKCIRLQLTSKNLSDSWHLQPQYPVPVLYKCLENSKTHGTPNVAVRGSGSSCVSLQLLVSLLLSPPGHRHKQRMGGQGNGKATEWGPGQLGGCDVPRSNQRPGSQPLSSSPLPTPSLKME